MANNQNKLTVYDIVLVGMMAALVFVGTYLHLDVMTPMGKVMIHFGNVFCLLAGMLLGGVRGGLAAGIGSMLYDVMDPAYISECWLTFINKFMMAFLCGIIVSYGIKKIAALQQKSENGTLVKKTSLFKTKVGPICGMTAMVILAVLVGIQGVGTLAAFTSEDAFNTVIKFIACVMLCLVLIGGVVFGIRKMLGKATNTNTAEDFGKQQLFAYRLVGGIAGILGYLVLYLGKTFVMGLLQKQEMTTIYTTLITKGSVSLINGIIAVVVSIILIPYFVMALQSTGMAKKLVKGKSRK